MIWLIVGNESHQIISCNMSVGDNLYELWVTRPNGKSLKVSEHKERKEIEELKDAIDYAISIGSKTFTITTE